MNDLARALAALAPEDGYSSSALADVRLLRSAETLRKAPVTYAPSIVFVAQGTKRGRFTYDARNYLVLAVPLPFECETIGTAREPMLGMAVRVDPAMVAEILLELDPLPAPLHGSPRAIDAVPLPPELADAALRLARALRSPAEARLLGPAIIREIVYRALLGGQGAALRALASPQNALGQVARALRRIHAQYAGPLDVATLAREAGMSVSAFHARFKAVTAKAPLQYIQRIRLHKALNLMIAGEGVAAAAERVGYRSPSQFSREFKRLFGGTPREISSRFERPLAMFSEI